jgi:hypothetical protein
MNARCDKVKKFYLVQAHEKGKLFCSFPVRAHSTCRAVSKIANLIDREAYKQSGVNRFHFKLRRFRNQIARLSPGTVLKRIAPILQEDDLLSARDYIVVVMPNSKNVEFKDDRDSKTIKFKRTFICRRDPGSKSEKAGFPQKDPQVYKMLTEKAKIRDCQPREYLKKMKYVEI